MMSSTHKQTMSARIVFSAFASIRSGPSVISQICDRELSVCVPPGASKHRVCAFGIDGATHGKERLPLSEQRSAVPRISRQIGPEHAFRLIKLAGREER